MSHLVLKILKKILSNRYHKTLIQLRKFLELFNKEDLVKIFNYFDHRIMESVKRGC